jgi:hypothetical protein
MWKGGDDERWEVMQVKGRRKVAVFLYKRGFRSWGNHGRTTRNGGV